MPEHKPRVLNKTSIPMVPLMAQFRNNRQDDLLNKLQQKPLIKDKVEKYLLLFKMPILYY